MKYFKLGGLGVGLAVILVSLFGSTASQTHPQVIRAHADSIANLADDRHLVGVVENVFVGTVTEQLGTTFIDEDPETQFSVQVLENLKGSLGGKVVVNQQGGLDRGVLLLVGNDELLKPGQTYLFATRPFKERGWHTLVSEHGDLLIEDAKQREAMVARFKEAVRNEIPYQPK